MRSEQSSGGEQDHLDSECGETCPASSIDIWWYSWYGNDKPFTDGSEVADIFGKENIDLHEMSIKKQARRTEEDFVIELHSDDDSNTENNYHSGVWTFKDRKTPHFDSPSDDHSNDSDDSGSDILDQIANHGALGSSSRNAENFGTDRKSLSSQYSVGSDNVEKHSEKTDRPKLIQVL